MALTKQKKVEIVSDLKEKFSSQKGIVFMNFSHLSTSDLSELRKKAREANCQLKVVKKTLLRLAAQEEGWWTDDLEKGDGSLAIMLGFDNEMTPAKLVYNFTKEHTEASIKGGLGEKRFQAAEEVIELAELPDYQTLVQQFVGTIQAPLTNFVGVLENNYKGLLYCLSQIKN